MHAEAGDQIIIRGNHVGEPDVDGEILEVRGHDGEPPYRIRWSKDGHESLLYPGPGAMIRHHGQLVHV